MTIKIQGSSNNNEFVYCYHCGEKYVWLNGYPNGQGEYTPICRKCRLKGVMSN